MAGYPCRFQTVGSGWSFPTRGFRIPTERWRTLLLVGLVLLTGCPNRTETDPANAPRAAASQAVRSPLRVMVVDDPPMGETVRREWLALDEREVLITHLTTTEFQARLKDDALTGDAIIYPTPWLGTLAQSGRIVRMPGRIRDSELFQESDVLPWVLRGELNWGNELYAVPLGSVTFVMVSRSATVPSADDVPITWELLDGQDVRVAHPLAKGWAAWSLLARAAAYSRSAGQISTLFDFRTMQPLIDTPPFRRALKELVASTQSVPDQIEWTPRDVQSALFAGACDVGFTWMTDALANQDTAEVSLMHGELMSQEKATRGSGAPPDPADDPAGRWRFFELPGSNEAYRPASASWSPRRDDAVASVPLIGMAGRIGSVLKGSRRERVAWSFLAKLSSADSSRRVSVASQWTGPFRRSHASAGPWMDPRIGTADSGAYGRAVQSAFSRNIVFQTLRIPGFQEYMAALDKAVRDAVIQGEDGGDRLAGVAREWEAITRALGRESQLSAYRLSLGIP